MARTPASRKRKERASVSAAEPGTPVASSRKRAASTEQRQCKRVQVKTETEETSQTKTSPTEPKIAKSSITMSDPLYGAIVDFKVGEDRSSFAIHRGLLCRASSFFKQRLSTSETAGGDIFAQVIELEDEDPEIFARFHTWLYSEKLALESESCKDIPWRIIMNVYAFGERTGMPRLQNTCIDNAIMKRKEGGLFPNQVDVNTLWRCTGGVFLLRRLLLDLFASECDLGDALAHNGSLHPQFLHGLVQVLYDMKVKKTIYKDVDFWKKRRSYYVINQENPIVVD